MLSNVSEVFSSERVSRSSINSKRASLVSSLNLLLRSIGPSGRVQGLELGEAHSLVSEFNSIPLISNVLVSRLRVVH